MLRARIAIGASTLLMAFATGTSAQQRLDATHSEIAFTSRQMGVPVDGRFKRFDAQILFDPKQPENARIAIAVDLASVALGAAEIETELGKPPWFDSLKFPRASFQSTGLKAGAPGRFEVAGKFTLKGVSRDLVVPVTLAQSGAVTTASGSFTIKRLDFGIGDGEWNDTSLVADEVRVRFKLVLGGVGPL
jgi:polyisoprenoid-binding protein YceI